MGDSLTGVVFESPPPIPFKLISSKFDELVSVLVDLSDKNKFDLSMIMFRLECIILLLLMLLVVLYLLLVVVVC